MNEVPTIRLAALEMEARRIVQNLVGRYRPRCIILFGSVAHGEVGEWSDIDLCVIKDTDTPFLRRMVDARLAADTSEPMDVLVYTSAEWLQMLREGNYFVRDEILGRGRVLHGDLP